MKKQVLLLLGSFWGAIVIPLGYLNGLASNQVIHLWEGLHSSLAVALLAISWGWYAPALGVAKLLGILDPLYGFCIFVFPRNPWGYLLPVLCWYAVFNLVARLRRKRAQGDSPPPR